MTQCRFISVDLETTGFSPSRGDRVIEVGAVIVEDRRIAGEFQSLVNIGKSVPRAASLVHGITDELLDGQPPAEEVYPKLRSFLSDGILVAHNAQFDITFLRHEFGRIGLGFSNSYHCSLAMSRRRFPRLRDHTLETVYKHLFGITPGNAQKHRALDDARMVARVWMEMGER